MPSLPRPWLRSLTRLPVLLKGIVDPEDARRALHCGVDGLIVSNHGGRTLDGVPAAIDLLPAITRAVNGQFPVLMDGGVRRGTDVLRALALGPSAVLVGRPILHALATAGALGVAHCLQVLRAEFELAMALTGYQTLADQQGLSVPPTERQ
jgi:4-hydroxymandelate oxidase